MALLPCVCVDCMCYQAAHMSNEEDVNIDVWDKRTFWTLLRCSK